MRTKYIKIVSLSVVVVTALVQQAIAADNMSEVDHNQMDHHKMATNEEVKINTKKPASMSMQGGDAPADARDPHAYSGGYDFGPNAPLLLADKAYRASVIFNRIENSRSNINTVNVYDMVATIGKDYDQLLIKAEGEVDSGTLQESRTELLWGHAITTFWNTQLGVRADGGIEPNQNWLALGVRGLAPYWFEVDATVYIGEQGNSAIRVEAEYELLLTQKLVLQPRIEANLFGKTDTLRELGSGLSNLTTGIRLRYEFIREFAPYVGVEWNNKFGETADFARAAGNRTNITNIVGGIRFWY